MKFKVNFMESVRSIKQPLGLFMSDNKRNLFEEIIDGLRQIRRSRESKEIIETLSVDPLDVSSIDGEQLVAIRQKLNVSTAVFARLILTTEKTLQKWESGETKITNKQTLLLLHMLYKEPIKTIKLIEAVL